MLGVMQDLWVILERGITAGMQRKWISEAERGGLIDSVARRNVVFSY